MSGAMGSFTSPDWSEKPQPVPYAGNNPLKNRDLDGHCTVDGEEHGCLWRAAHSLGLVQTQKEQADAARRALWQMYGFSIGGQTPADIAENGTNRQVIAAYKTVNRFLTAVGEESLSELICPNGVTCGVIPIGSIKGPIPSVAPVTLAKQLPLQEAAAAGASGAAKVAMTELVDAPKLVANYGPGRWVKMQWVYRAKTARRSLCIGSRSRLQGCRSSLSSNRETVYESTVLF